MDHLMADHIAYCICTVWGGSSPPSHTFQCIILRTYPKWCFLFWYTAESQALSSIVHVWLIYWKIWYPPKIYQRLQFFMKDFIEVATASNKQNIAEVIYNVFHYILVLLSYEKAFTVWFNIFCFPFYVFHVRDSWYTCVYLKQLCYTDWSFPLIPNVQRDTWHDKSVGSWDAQHRKKKITRFVLYKICLIFLFFSNLCIYCEILDSCTY